MLAQGQPSGHGGASEERKGKNLRKSFPVDVHGKFPEHRGAELISATSEPGRRFLPAGRCSRACCEGEGRTSKGEIVIMTRPLQRVA